MFEHPKLVIHIAAETAETTNELFLQKIFEIIWGQAVHTIHSICEWTVLCTFSCV